MRMMVVEDDPIVAEGIAAILELIDHDVVGVAYTGQEALRMARKLRPDMLLMDINLPDFSGIEVLAELETDMVIPCIFLTAYTDQKLIDMASERSSSYGYLIKPTNENELKAAINIALMRYNEKNQLQEQLQNARKDLEDRKLIERAKGLLMDNMGMKEADAMAMLQKRSSDRNKKLGEIAKEVLLFWGHPSKET